MYTNTVACSPDLSFFSFSRQQLQASTSCRVNVS